MFPLMLINFVLLRSTDGNESRVVALTKGNTGYRGRFARRGRPKRRGDQSVIDCCRDRATCPFLRGKSE